MCTYILNTILTKSLKLNCSSVWLSSEKSGLVISWYTIKQYWVIPQFRGLDLYKKNQRALTEKNIAFLESMDVPLETRTSYHVYIAIGYEFSSVNMASMATDMAVLT